MSLLSVIINHKQGSGNTCHNNLKNPTLDINGPKSKEKKRKSENKQKCFQVLGKQNHKYTATYKSPKKRGYISIIRRIIESGGKPDHQIKYQENQNQDIGNADFSSKPNPLTEPNAFDKLFHFVLPNKNQSCLSCKSCQRTMTTCSQTKKAALVSQTLPLQKIQPHPFIPSPTGIHL